MGILFTLLSIAFGFFGSLLILRAYLWTMAISPRDPIVRFVWTITDWLCNPIGYAVKPRGNWDWTSLAATLLTAVVHTLLLREAAGLPATVTGFFLMPVALIIRWAVDLLIWGTIIYCFLSFTRGQMSPVYRLLGTLIDPFLRPIRRFMPRIGGFDLSPVVLFIVANLVLRFAAPLSSGAFLY